MFTSELLNDTHNIGTYMNREDKTFLAPTLQSTFKHIHLIAVFFKVHLLYGSSSRVLSSLWLGGKFLGEYSYRCAYKRCFYCTSVWSQSPNSLHNWKMVFPNIGNNIWTECNCFVPNKVKEIPIKVLYRHCSCNKFIHVLNWCFTCIFFLHREGWVLSFVFYIYIHSSNFFNSNFVINMMMMMMMRSLFLWQKIWS